MSDTSTYPTETAAQSAAAQLNAQVYDRLPDGYADYWRYMAAPRFRMATILSLLSRTAPRTVADLGCGTGLLLAHVALRLPTVRRIGIDIAPRQIDVARRCDPAASWYVLDLDHSSPTIPDELRNACQAVVATELIEHLDHPRRLLRSARELAAPGARLILSTQSGPVRETERRVGHRRHFSAPELAQLLNDSGWTPLRVWNAGWPFHDLSKWWANRNADDSMQRFGERPYGWSERAVCWALRQLFRLNSRRRGAQLFAVAELGGEPTATTE